jgi:hypothetical protein
MIEKAGRVDSAVVEADCDSVFTRGAVAALAVPESDLLAGRRRNAACGQLLSLSQFYSMNC